MQNIIFNLAQSHIYGSSFYDYLGLRKRFFVDALGWDIPHDDDVEMDQYDNPTAWYSLVVRDGEVVGGARAMATTACWGHHSYMLRDAIQGKLVDIPASILADDIVRPDMWECTRLVMSDDVSSHADRAKCLSLVVQGLIDVAADRGGADLISLSPLALTRTLRQLGFGAKRIGEPYLNEGDGRRYAVLSMPAEHSGKRSDVPTYVPQPKPQTRPQVVHAPAI